LIFSVNLVLSLIEEEKDHILHRYQTLYFPLALAWYIYEHAHTEHSKLGFHSTLIALGPCQSQVVCRSNEQQRSNVLHQFLPLPLSHEGSLLFQFVYSFGFSRHLQTGSPFE